MIPPPLASAPYREATIPTQRPAEQNCADEEAKDTWQGTLVIARVDSILFWFWRRRAFLFPFLFSNNVLWITRHYLLQQMPVPLVSGLRWHPTIAMATAALSKHSHRCPLWSCQRTPSFKQRTGVRLKLLHEMLSHNPTSIQCGADFHLQLSTSAK